MTADLSIQQLKELVQEIILSQKKAESEHQQLRAGFKDIEARFKETDKKFKETNNQFKQTDARIKQAFDLFEGQWGKLMESLVEGDLVNLLRQRGIPVNDTSTRVKGKRGEKNYEFDIIAHNGEEVVIVEVKTTLRIKHVKRFIEKLKDAKNLMPRYKDNQIIGAIAYLRAEEESETFAQKQKLFAIRATGDSAAIVNSPDFEPRIF